MSALGFWRSKPPPGVHINRMHPLANGLACQLLLNEGSGRLVRDTAPLTGQDGVLGTITSATWDKRSGPAGNCLDFANTGGSTANQYVDFGDTVVIEGQTEVSFEMWFRCDTVSAFMSVLRLNGCLVVQVNSGPLRIVGWPGGSAGFCDISPSLVAGEWTHVVGSFREGHWHVYQQGQLVALAQDPAGSGAFASTANPLRLGGTEGGSEAFDGQIALVRFWHRGLIDVEAQQLYNAPFAILQPPVWERLFVPSAVVTTKAPPPYQRKPNRIWTRRRVA